MLLSGDGRAARAGRCCHRRHRRTRPDLAAAALAADAPPTSLLAREALPAELWTIDGIRSKGSFVGPWMEEACDRNY